MARNNNTETKVLVYLEPILEERQLELVDLEFIKEGANWYLRVYIDKDGGVDIVDCEAVSRAFEAKLDEVDPIEQPYILEVSSPGIDRPLKKDADFVRFTGEVVDIKLYQALHGAKQHQGELIGKVDEVISIKNEEGTTLAFEAKSVASIRLAILF